MHQSIAESVAFERGKNSVTDGEEYFNDGSKRDISTNRHPMEIAISDYRHPMEIATAHDCKEMLSQVEYQLEELIYMVGDMKEPPTEDQLLNYMIGMVEGLRVKKSKLFRNDG